MDYSARMAFRNDIKIDGDCGAKECRVGEVEENNKIVVKNF